MRDYFGPPAYIFVSASEFVKDKNGAATRSLSGQKSGRACKFVAGNWILRLQRTIITVQWTLLLLLLLLLLLIIKIIINANSAAERAEETTRAPKTRLSIWASVQKFLVPRAPAVKKYYAIVQPSPLSKPPFTRRLFSSGETTRRTRNRRR